MCICSVKRTEFAECYSVFCNFIKCLICSVLVTVNVLLSNAAFNAKKNLQYWH
jgi:hypothetical protein